MTTQQTAGERLTVEEAAAFLRLKPSTIRAWILAKRISYLKVGRRVFVRRADLDALLDASLIRAKPSKAA
ncbi:MAG TPA: helix-turn-helix domain-containing protein [Candidatus Acidoferrum sp.]|nr:helix-turn-helix domain-containing protein [Candidatus Acidoferrum sp.]